jgi:hypothetical protein
MARLAALQSLLRRTEGAHADSCAMIAAVFAGEYLLDAEQQRELGRFLESKT